MTETSILDVLVLGAGPVGLTLANELLRLGSPTRCIWNCGKREVRGKSHPLTASSIVGCPARYDERGRTFARYMLYKGQQSPGGAFSRPCFVHQVMLQAEQQMRTYLREKTLFWLHQNVQAGFPSDYRTAREQWFREALARRHEIFYPPIMILPQKWCSAIQ